MDWSSWNDKKIASLLRSWQGDAESHTVYIIEKERTILIQQTYWIGYQCSETEWKYIVSNYKPSPESFSRFKKQPAPIFK